MRSDFDPKINVSILIYEKDADGTKLVGRRDTHNVMTNRGKEWLMQRLGGSNYGVSPPTPHRTDVIKYVGFGVGGALQSNAAFLHSQLEIPTVVAIQDPIAYSVVAGTNKRYLKTVNAQVLGDVDDFPAFNRTVFTLDVLETEISFPGSRSLASNVLVDTLVPVSEAGLYLSSAVPTYDPGAPLGAGNVDPRSDNFMVCYNIFEPIPVTPNTLLRILWEIRC
jgi:hypothetical protein